MRLTRYTDYAVRVLLYLAARPDRLSSIAEIARAYGISQHHLMKVASGLASAGYVVSSRGRAGGIRLARPPGEISLGDVVRHTERGASLADCDSCVIAPACGFTGALKQALEAFMSVLDRYTIEDVMAKRAQMAALLSPGAPPSAEAASVRPPAGG